MTGSNYLFEGVSLNMAGESGKGMDIILETFLLMYIGLKGVYQIYKSSKDELYFNFSHYLYM